MISYKNIGGVLLGIFIVVFLYIAYIDIFRPFPLQQTVVIGIPQTYSAKMIASELEDKKLIHSKYSFLALARLSGKSKSLQAGFYEICPGDTLQQFLAKLVKGDVVQKEFTIIEGTTYSQVLASLKKSPFIMMDGIHLADNENAAIEGWYLAETYRYKAGTNASQLLKRAKHALNETLIREWNYRDKTLPYTTPYQLLIVASIIEKEANIDTERKLISGVIVNRLSKKMRLQMDPTVIYAIKEKYNGNLTRDDLNVDSPYNTYKRQGLPPTPIAMVGESALIAAAHPIHNDYLYYVAKGDGTHQFSSTYEAQKNAVEQYIKKVKNDI
jgi:peptidoglycan lytic transglycosylase G